MRDKNQTLFNFIEEISSFIDTKLKGSFLRRTTVAVNPTVLNNEEWTIVYPSRFKDLRDLAIVQYWFPEPLHWRVLLDLQEKSYSWLNEKQRIELSILLSSKDNMLTYLYLTERYSACEIFGNMIKNGLRPDLLRIQRRQHKIVRPQRKRGYDDKGSLRDPTSHLEKFDWTFDQLFMNELQKKLNRHRHLDHILLSLEEYFKQQKNSVESTRPAESLIC